MSNDTVTIRGIVFDIDDLEEAIERVEDANGRTQNRTAVVGDVFVAGDPDPDGYVRATLREHVESVSPGVLSATNSNYIFTTTESIRRHIEDARTVPFEEYLEDRDYFDSGNKIVTSGLPDRYDAAVEYDHGNDGYLFLQDSEMQGFIEDDGVTVGKVKRNRLYLRDARDE